MLIKLIKSLFPALTEEQEKQIEAELGKSFKPLADFTKVETELKSTAEQLKTASDTLKSFEGQDIEKIQKSAKDWEDKYTTETAKLHDELKSLQLDSAADKFLSSQKFASDRVKTSVKADLLAKGFKLEDGNFIGADTWLEGLKKSEPTAFADDKPGFFMDKTQPSATNTMQSEVFKGFGLPTQQS